MRPPGGFEARGGTSPLNQSVRCSLETSSFGWQRKRCDRDLKLQVRDVRAVHLGHNLRISASLVSSRQSHDRWRRRWLPFRSNARRMIMRLAALCLIAVLCSQPASADLSQTGSWTTIPGLGSVGWTNAILLRSGKVLVADILGGNPSVFNPATNTFTGYDLDIPCGLPGIAFSNCYGQAAQGDGRVLFYGIRPALMQHHASLYDPMTCVLTTLSAPEPTRYYPTTTTLGDGRILVSAGNAGGA